MVSTGASYSVNTALLTPAAMVGGQVAAGEIAEANPLQEVVLAAGTFVGIGSGNLMVLAQEINNQRERMTSYVIEAMLDDDAVKPALDTIKLQALNGELKFEPSVDSDLDNNGQADDPDGPDPEEAKRACHFCERAHANLDVPIPIWARDAMNALAFGHKVAEKVLTLVTEGPDAGLYTLASLKMKPRWSYHLCTDPYYNLRALYCQTPSGPAYVDVDHFVVFTWDMRDGDPRGSSVLRAATDYWRRKQRAKDSRSKGDDQWGTPSVAHELPPNVQPTTNDPISGKAISTVAYANQQLAAFQNGASFTYSNGGDVKVIESQRDGVQIGNSIDNYDRGITRAMLLQAKATMEGKHYTQGGGEIGQDLMASFGGFVRAWFLATMRRQVFYWLLEVNFGKPYADLYTPRMTIGDMAMDDFSKLASPLSVLGQAGLLTPSQLNALLTKGGVPRPLPGELRIGPAGPIPDTLPEPIVEPAAADGGVA